MPIALVLLIVAFLALPLIQQLMRAAQASQGRDPAQENDGAPPVREPEPVLAMTDAPVPAAPSDPEPVPSRNIAGSPSPASQQRATTVLGRGERINLRSAIVLMTVIGPCRAVRPYDSSGLEPVR